MLLRKTEPGELGKALEILSEGRRAIAALGIDQWQDGYPSREIIENDIEKGISYVLEHEGHIEGTVVLMKDREPTYDVIYEGKWLLDTDSYFTIHRIALSDALRGKGAAAFIVESAKAMASESGCLSVRVDTHKGNVAMRRMLEKNGFVYCGVILLDDSGLESSRRVAYELLL